VSTRTFHIGTILAITTGKLVSPDGMDGIYGICDWMTGDTLYTHQLIRAADECAPSLREQFPDLAGITVPESVTSKEALLDWLTELAARHGTTREVAPLAAELRKMAPHAQVITVEIPDGGAA